MPRPSVSSGTKSYLVTEGWMTGDDADGEQRRDRGNEEEGGRYENKGVKEERSKRMTERHHEPY